MACGDSKSHRTIGFFVFFICVLGAPDTDYPLDADCVGGAYFPCRKARWEVPPPPSNNDFDGARPIYDRSSIIDHQLDDK